MKKLMIAAAIVCAAVMSQAAAIQWSAYMVYDSDGKTVLTSGDISLAKIVGDSFVAVDTQPIEADSGESWAQGSYVLVVDSDADGDQFTLTYGGKQMTDLAGDPIVYTLSGFGNDPKSTSVPGADFENVMAASVPEPTSGLLLLLGVAGLALKRRRA